MQTISQRITPLLPPQKSTMVNVTKKQEVIEPEIKTHYFTQFKTESDKEDADHMVIEPEAIEDIPLGLSENSDDTSELKLNIAPERTLGPIQEIDLTDEEMKHEAIPPMNPINTELQSAPPVESEADSDDEFPDINI
jgi:hypothetical protein